MRTPARLAPAKSWKIGARNDDNQPTMARPLEEKHVSDPRETNDNGKDGLFTYLETRNDPTSQYIHYKRPRGRDSAKDTMFLKVASTLMRRAFRADRETWRNNKHVERFTSPHDNDDEIR